jgi:hypothetical protein
MPAGRNRPLQPANRDFLEQSANFSQFPHLATLRRSVPVGPGRRTGPGLPTTSPTAQQPPVDKTAAMGHGRHGCHRCARIGRLSLPRHEIGPRPSHFRPIRDPLPIAPLRPLPSLRPSPQRRTNLARQLRSLRKISDPSFSVSSVISVSPCPLCGLGSLGVLCVKNKQRPSAKTISGRTRDPPVSVMISVYHCLVRTSPPTLLSHDRPLA